VDEQRYYLGPDGAIAGKYDKIKLTPFGEHFPLGRRFPILQKALDRFTDSAGFTPGGSTRSFTGRVGFRRRHLLGRYVPYLIDVSS